MDKNAFEKFNIRFWLLYSTSGQIFSSIRPSASAKCKNAPSVIHWFWGPTFAFRRKCVRDAARIVCFCNLTTFF